MDGQKKMESWWVLEQKIDVEWMWILNDDEQIVGDLKCVGWIHSRVDRKGINQCVNWCICWLRRIDAG